ncbi:MAG: phosphotransferase family protein [Amphibacillus sp.]|nr:phosphotransferase family protein [Amphibacillus sp.]
MQHVLGKDWVIKSAGGSSGEAYYAQSKQKRIFLKRNSSPFLAVLSAQGIVPKLIWTKRLENGDVITAQEWHDGREMQPEVIHHPKVAELLGRIHHSAELLDMLTRMGKKPLRPTTLYREIEQTVLENDRTNSDLIINDALAWMRAQLSKLIHIKPVVCHGDLNHNNWLITNKGQLYLIDWDNAAIGDPAIDLAMLFSTYVENKEWDMWLMNYGVKSNRSLYLRIHWYMLYQVIREIHSSNKDEYQVQKARLIEMLARANNYITQ